MIQEISSIFTVANSLWNNLLEPVGTKATTWNDIFSINFTAQHRKNRI